MSYERVLEALMKLGLSDKDAEIYIYLATEGPQKPQKIMMALKVYEQQVDQSLKSLESKGIVSPDKEQAAQFKALPFDKVLDSLLKAHWREARNMQDDKTEILSQWKSLLGKCTKK